MECLNAASLIVSLLGIAALVIAIGLSRRVGDLTRSVALLEQEVRALRDLVRRRAEPEAAPPAPAPPVVTAPEPAPGVPGPVFEPAPVEPLPEPLPLPPPAPAPPQPPRVSLEERLGARLPVWLGSIALALAGAFLVKYSVDQGWLSPVVRVSLAVAFGLVLLAGGELLRRSSARIAQGLSAAGVADLFASFLAGVHLYQLISPAVGFVLMALTTAVAVALSLRQGPMVALIGLVGGFLTPAWIETGEPDARTLFAYLLLLEAGLLAVSRRRGWPAVAGLALAASVAWVVVWLAGPFAPGDAVWVGLFLLLTVAAALAAALPGRGEESFGHVPALGLGGGALLAATLAAALLAQRGGFSTTEWAFFGLLAAGTLVLGRARPAFAGLPWVAAAAGALLLVAWSWENLAQPPRFLGTALALGTLFAAGAWAAAVLRFRGAAAPRPGLWAALSAAAAVAYFLVAYGATVNEAVEVPWGIAALALALAYIGASAALVRRRAAEGDRAAPLAAFAVAATTFVSLAVPLELERSWISVAWALEVPALLWLAGRFRLPVLTTLARLLAGLVVVRLLLNPEVLEYPIGQGALLNWLLLGYGVPLVAFAAGAVLARRQGDGPTRFGLELGALAFAAAYLTLEIGQLFHPGDPEAGPVGLAQWGAWTTAWLALGWGALALQQPRPSPGLADEETGDRLPGGLGLGGFLLVWAGLCGTVLGQGMVANPLWEHLPVGELPVLNLLLWAYGAPAALLLAVASWRARNRASRAALVWAVAGLGLLFVLVSLEVRQFFHGTFLDTGATSVAEGYAYSAAWVLFGTALLVLGIVRRGRMLRYASLVVMLAAVGKAFLYDTANLGGLYRVFSFLGLGASLLLLAFLYQRFVFREERS